MIPIESVGAQLASQADIFPIPTTAGVLRDARVVGIVGSRDYPELDRVDQLVALLHPEAIIVSGHAGGVDQRAIAAALGTYRPGVELKPLGSSKQQWIAAAFWRNGAIALVADVVVAFWTGESPGTADTIRKALKGRGLCIVALPSTEPQIWVPRI